jgi:hypothetical protein
MTTNRLRLTELDFDNIKSNLKTYLNDQEIFSDYDFEGSGLNILLDISPNNELSVGLIDYGNATSELTSFKEKKTFDKNKN